MFRALALVALLLLTGPAFSQAWPTKMVTLVVPFPTGGSADPIARAISASLGKSLGQTFLVENKPGASGAIGTAQVARAAPDGYTFVVVFDTHAVNPFLMPDIKYTEKDLQPVMLVGIAPLVLATLPSKPFRNLGDVVQAAKAKPGTITFGSVQNGSTGHLEMMLWQEAAGVQLIHAPYRGAGPMVTDALGGHIDLAIGSAAVIAPQVRGGKLRALAVTGEKRSPVMPEAATLAEQGYPGLNAYAWWGIYAPAGLPKPILDKFHAEVTKAFSEPDTIKLFQDQLGMQLVLSTPEDMRKFVSGEMDRWSRTIKDKGIKAD